MKVLTAAQMREVDRRTIEMGISGIVLMENAGHRVVEFLDRRFRPLAGERVVVLCGKGNNGGDGMVIARQLYTRFPTQALHVVLFASPDELRGDARTNYEMLRACGCPVLPEIPPEARAATLVVDALLGTGLSGPATGRMLDGIREINSGFPLAQVIAVDIPSGMASDSGVSAGEVARADCTVTFTAPKVAHAVPPNCDRIGQLIVGAIGSPSSLLANAPLALVAPEMFRAVLAPRPLWGHKGTFGHVLVVAGSRGKTGAAAMTGLSALRAGAGLVTVASPASAVGVIAGHAPELMTEPLAETAQGSIAAEAELDELARGKTVIAMGPGLGSSPGIRQLVTAACDHFEQPLVLDADALIGYVPGPANRIRVLTPHPGEMARLTGTSIREIQDDRVAAARGFSTQRGATLVLKGQRTVIAFPDGRAWINPTGTPALGTGGSGDVLTGLIAGYLAQFPDRPDEAVAAAVYLHGLAGQIGARTLGEQGLIATDILHYLRQAVEECADLSHRQ